MVLHNFVAVPFRIVHQRWEERFSFFVHGSFLPEQFALSCLAASLLRKRTLQASPVFFFFSAAKFSELHEFCERTAWLHDNAWLVLSARARFLPTQPTGISSNVFQMQNDPRGKLSHLVGFTIVANAILYNTRKCSVYIHSWMLYSFVNEKPTRKKLKCDIRKHLKK